MGYRYAPQNTTYENVTDTGTSFFRCTFPFENISPVSISAGLVVECCTELDEGFGGAGGGEVKRSGFFRRYGGQEGRELI